MGEPCRDRRQRALEVDLLAQGADPRRRDRVVRAGDLVAIDGTTGAITTDDVPLGRALEVGERSSSTRAEVGRRAAARWRVRANADTSEDAAKAREFGAEGIGLCRTEHMFMAPTASRRCGG